MNVLENTTSSPKASYEVNTLGLDVGPLHRQLLMYFNEMHEAQATGDVETIQELEEIVPPLIEEFEATECRLTENPGWLLNKMRAGWHVAMGDFNSALAFERIGYRFAKQEFDQRDEGSARRLSVSASNIADQLWRLGQAKEGLPWAQLSVDLWPSNTVNHLVLAITANHAGLHDEANEILEKLCQIAKSDDEQDALSRVMMFERELDSIISLPAAQGLLEQ